MRKKYQRYRILPASTRSAIGPWGHPQTVFPITPTYLESRGFSPQIWWFLHFIPNGGCRFQRAGGLGLLHETFPIRSPKDVWAFRWLSILNTFMLIIEGDILLVGTRAPAER